VFLVDAQALHRRKILGQQVEDFDIQPQPGQPDHGRYQEEEPDPAPWVLEAGMVHLEV